MKNSNYSNNVDEVDASSCLETSLITHMQNPQQEQQFAYANITVNHAIATLVAVTLVFHKSALSCFILNKIFDMFQQEINLYVG